jgi:hypothetical protein
MEVIKIDCDTCGFRGVIINNGDNIDFYHCPLCSEVQCEEPVDYPVSVDFNIFKQL